jgi:hypothetical protein
MNPEIEKLVSEIREREARLEQRFRQAEREFRYELHGRRVRFSQEIRELHRRYRIGLLRYLRRARPLNVVTAPVIYAMIVPLLILDASVTLYQQICFRAYGVPRVRRRNYLVVDRHRLGYLNPVEKLNCAYCSYANGLIAYAREVLARTEQYWCPIRHARPVLDAHARYAGFVDYGDAPGYREGLDRLRRSFD